MQESSRVLEKIRRSEQEKKQFRRDFLNLSAEERVRIWKLGEREADYTEQALIAGGADVVPFLTEIVKNNREKLFHRWEAMRVLCDMDRFVPRNELLLPQFANVGPTGREGVINRYSSVTGRRIGQEGLDALHWAADHADKEVRFHAQEVLELLDKQLSRLTVEEKVRRWAVAIEKNRGDHGGFVNPDEYLIGSAIKRQLVEQAPDSIPLLVSLLETSKSGYVREATISLLEWIDLTRVRLRALPDGRAAIHAVDKAIQLGNMKPVFTRLDERERWRKVLSASFLRDEWPVYHEIDLLVEAGELLEKEDKQSRLPSKDHSEMQAFVTYLTALDPFFPSWEFINVYNVGRAEVAHPRFKAKVDRFYAEWKRFKALARSER
jgi:hypothetical protein